MSAIEQLKRTGFICISPSKARGRRFCCVTAFPSPGIRGAISFQRSRPPASMPLRPTCAAMADRIGRKRSSNTPSCILSATWWVCSMPWRIEQAAIAGHDWGAPVAWHAALLRPDRFRAVIGLSVPYRPRTSVVPTSVMPQRDDAVFYQLYFQTPGVAEAEFERDVRTTLAKILYAASGDAPRPPGAGGGEVAMVSRDGGFLTRMPVPDILPAWLSKADLDFYVGEFTRTGFRGGLNWYRNIDRSWELLAPFAQAKVTVPALYMAGDRDLVVAFRNMDKAIANLATYVPQLRGSVILPGCGHWTQQERAAEVSAAMIDFLRKL